MANRKVSFDIVVNVKDAVKSIKELNEKISGLKGKFLSLASTLGITFGVTHFIRRAVDNFLEYEKTLARISQTLLVTGQYHSDVIDRMIKKQAELQHRFAINDEQIRETQNLFLYFDVPIELLDELTEATAKFAKALEMDIGTAGFIVAKSIGGATNMLSRYGVEFKKTGDLMKDTISAIEGLTIRFGSAGESVFFSHAKELERLKLAWDETLEDIGKGIVWFFDNVSGLFSPSYKIRLETTKYLQDIMIATQEFYTKGRAEALEKYSKLEKDKLTKILNERKEALKKFESDVYIFKTEYSKARREGAKEDVIGYLEARYMPSVRSYQKIRGEIEAVNFLIDEAISREQEQKKKIEEKEKKYQEYLRNLQDEYKFHKAREELTINYLENLQKIINLEQKSAETRKRYPIWLELEEFNKEVAKVLSILQFRQTIKPIEDYRYYNKVTGVIEIPAELKFTEFYLEDLLKESQQTIIKEALFRDFAEFFREYFEYYEIVAQEFIGVFNNSFEAVIREIGRSFNQMFEEVFGQANSLLEIFLQTFIQGLTEVLVKLAIFEVVKAIFGTPAIGLVLHRGGIVKAHSGLLTRDEIPIIAKKGEMILNERQQSILWNMLNYRNASNEQSKQYIYISIDGDIIAKKVIEKRMPTILNKVSYAIR